MRLVTNLAGSHMRLSHLLALQSVLLQACNKPRGRDCITLTLAFLHWLPVIMIDLKFWLITFSGCQGLAPSYVLDLLTICEPLFCFRAPGSTDAGFVTSSQTVLSFKSPVKTQFCLFPRWCTAFSYSHVVLPSHLLKCIYKHKNYKNKPHDAQLSFIFPFCFVLLFIYFQNSMAFNKICNKLIYPVFFFMIIWPFFLTFLCSTSLGLQLSQIVFIICYGQNFEVSAFTISRSYIWISK